MPSFNEHPDKDKQEERIVAPQAEPHASATPEALEILDAVTEAVLLAGNRLIESDSEPCATTFTQLAETICHGHLLQKRAAALRKECQQVRQQSLHLREQSRALRQAPVPSPWWLVAELETGNVANQMQTCSNDVMEELITCLREKGLFAFRWQHSTLPMLQPGPEPELVQ